MSNNYQTGTVIVTGFGKIGQGITAAILNAGLRVHAIDQNAALADSVRHGSFRSTEPDVQERIQKAVTEGRFSIGDHTSRPQVTGDPVAILLALPLGVDTDRNPDATGFHRVLEQLSPLLEHNILLLVETSVPVGFCRNTIQRKLASLGKRHGTDYLLAHSPERIKSGSMLKQLHELPKIIGGYDAQATSEAVQFYSLFIPPALVQPVGSLEEAEFSKMAGMLYRDINIALANQLAQYADVAGIDLHRLIPLINSDREANLLQPGIGVGGHCTPVYPWFMIRNFRDADLEFSLAAEARNVNEAMPSAVLAAVIPQIVHRRAVILGLGFRPGVKEDSHSPAYPARDFLLKEGFEVGVHDLLYNADELRARGLDPVGDLYACGAELLVLVTMHPSYVELDWQLLHREGVRVIVDGRNALPAEHINAAGIRYRGIGHPGV